MNLYNWLPEPRGRGVITDHAHLPLPEMRNATMIDGTIVRSRSAEGIGLRFFNLLRSEERSLSRLLALRLPDHAI